MESIMSSVSAIDTNIILTSEQQTKKCFLSLDGTNVTIAVSPKKANDYMSNGVKEFVGLQINTSAFSPTKFINNSRVHILLQSVSTACLGREYYSLHFITYSN